MDDKLVGYEVIAGLIAIYMEKNNTTEIRIGNRMKLYDAVRQLCAENPDKIGVFKFRKRRGRYTSDDVDIVLRNMEDSDLLECLNPDLVDFRQKEAFKNKYFGEIKPKIEKMKLRDHFVAAVENL